MVGLEERLIFDIVLVANGFDTNPDEPVLFVKGEGKVIARIRKCARQARNELVRMQRLEAGGGKRGRKPSTENPTLQDAGRHHTGDREPAPAAGVFGLHARNKIS